MGSNEVLQTVGQVAGIGGLALGVFVLIFRDIVRRNIFPKLGPTHAYRVITLIVSLTFLISATGIGAYVYLQSPGKPDDVQFPPQSPEPVIMAHLALIDGHRYAEAYSALSNDAKQRISADVFNKVFEAQRAPQGRLLKRVFYGTAASRQLPDQTRGAFNTTTYLTDFEHGGRYVEAVTVRAERNEWRVLFHNLMPCRPPACS
ncbi:DUF4019 domain-containing protein [Massilia sp. PAMC28688]|uniref:DUF4019 domain-containing protein n=1 Tax=Massilia sp. PAMC28688 TaxID=2861283 RepID=UPI001C6315A7|nr:DUF4019 domain-containing protein [Massilia sp. PAMC28688]QYF94633.1 DUF4019 domain-containing protein [Massilia sp. PAMC28688]